MVYMHLILRECSGFVGAYHCRSAHGFAGVHASHKVVGLEHATHAVGQAQCHRHWQAFGYSHHHKRDGHHDGLQQISYKINI